MVEEADQIEDGQQGDHVAEHQAEISSWSEGDSSVLLLTPQSSVHSVVSVSDAVSRKLLMVRKPLTSYVARA